VLLNDPETWDFLAAIATFVSLLLRRGRPKNPGNILRIIASVGKESLNGRNDFTSALALTV
jgi:hypothetical protein